MKKYVFLLASIVLLGACSDTNDNSSDTEKMQATIDSLRAENEELKNGSIESETVEEESQTIESSDLDVKGLNDEQKIGDGSEDKYGLKIIKATTNLSESDDLYTNGKPENTVEVTYEYTNYNMETPINVNVQFLSAYDSNGSAGENMSMQDGQTEVPKGKSAKSTVWFVMDEPVTDQNEIEIVYGNDFVLGFDGDSVTYKVPLEH